MRLFSLVRFRTYLTGLPSLAEQHLAKEQEQYTQGHKAVKEDDQNS
ncbi:hypothetical protein ES703_65745 [subsurface metagenome]